LEEELIACEKDMEGVFVKITRTGQMRTPSTDRDALRAARLLLLLRRLAFSRMKSRICARSIGRYFMKRLDGWRVPGTT